MLPFSIFQRHSFFKRARARSLARRLHSSNTWCFFPTQFQMYWIYFVSFHFCTKDIILILNHLLLEHRAHAIACCLLPTSILCLNEKQGRLFQYIWLFCTFLLTINSFHFFHLKSGAHEKLVNSIWMWGKDSNIQYRNINNERATYFGILIRNDQPQSSWPFGWFCSNCRIVFCSNNMNVFFFPLAQNPLLSSCFLYRKASFDWPNHYNGIH